MEYKGVKEELEALSNDHYYEIESKEFNQNNRISINVFNHGENGEAHLGELAKSTAILMADSFNLLKYMIKKADEGCPEAKELIKKHLT